MSNFLVIGNRRVPPQQIAEVEPFEANCIRAFRRARHRKAQVSPINPDKSVVEESVQACVRNDER
jgi:hypothetical protein